MSIVLTSSSIAQSLEILPQVEVVESRLPSVFQVPNPIHRRLDRTEIDREVPANTTELLQSFPSVDAQRAGGEGGLTFVSIRGGEPNFTLFLLDGIKLNDPTNSRGGGVNLNWIPQQMIDSIEVSARPASAIQGSDGLSGIVNISTRPFSGVGLLGDLNSQDSKSGAFSFGGDISDNLNASLMFGRQDKTSGADKDSLQQSYLLGRAGSEPTEDLFLDLVFFRVDGDARSFPEDSGGDRLAVIRALEKRDFRLEAFGLNGEWDFADRLMLKGSTSWSSHREKADNPGIAAGVLDAVPAISGRRTFDRLDGQLYLLAEPADELSLTAGLAYDREKGTNDDLIDFGEFTVPADFDLERSSWSLFTELAYRPSPQLTLQLGLRHDMPDTASDQSSPSFGIGYLIPQADMTLSAHYGEGYKLPSLFALGQSLVGNPDLEPEFSKAIDLGLRKRWRSSGVVVGLSLFRSEYRDLIDFDPVLFTNVNRGRVEVEGVDAQVDWQANHKVSTNVYLTYSNADVVGESSDLRRRPDWKGGAKLSWSPDARLAWVTSVDYTGSFFDSSIATGAVKMPSYWRVDTALNWQYTDDIRVGLGIKNLLDDDYEESVGFSNGGVTVNLALSVGI